MNDQFASKSHQIARVLRTKDEATRFYDGISKYYDWLTRPFEHKLTERALEALSAANGILDTRPRPITILVAERRNGPRLQAQLKSWLQQSLRYVSLAHEPDKKLVQPFGHIRLLTDQVPFLVGI